MKFTGILLLVASFAVAQEPAVFSDLDFDAACAKAKESKRIVMVDFFTTWCGPCKKLDQTTWQDEKVVAWLGEKAVALKIDAEKEEALAKKYNVKSYPTILFLRADGTEIDRLVGFRNAKPFLEEAEDALAGRDAVSRAKAKLDGDEENNPMLRQDYGEALADRGRNEEALKEFLWCWDHGLEHRPSFVGVRASFLLSRISDLGKDYPPALDALRSRRDVCAEALLAGKGKINQAGDLADINKHIGEDTHTLELYDKLAKKEGMTRARDELFDALFEALLDARRYGDLVTGAGKSVDYCFRSWESAAAEAARENDEQMKGYAEYTLRNLVERCGGFYEAYLGKGLKEEAGALADRVVKAAPGGSTWAALIEHAVRAGDNDEALALVEKGLKATSADDADAIREAAKTIQGK